MPWHRRYDETALLYFIAADHSEAAGMRQAAKIKESMFSKPPGVA
jgi:hypothetical protein